MPLQDLRNDFPFPKDLPAVPEVDHGWFGPEHIELLSGVVGPNVKVALELGSWLGKSTRFLASKCPGAIVIAIDHWAGSSEHHLMDDCRPLLPVLYDTFIKNCWAWRDRIIPLKMDTVSGMRLVHRHGIRPDFIFIDAGHEYPSANADISTALALFPDSPLVGDDFVWEGVRWSVEEHVRAGRMKAFAKGNVWWRGHPAFGRVQGGVPVQ